ncbi:MAG: 3-oxoacyl-[acyl-carrier-protein] synthase III C-terminal domain-containing protein [Vulcanimicrobiota bacterium]
MRSRFYCGQDEDAAALARRATEAALGASGLEPAQVDLVVAACGTYQQPLPYRAATLLRDMVDWFPEVASFDVDSTCLSFVVACQVVANAFALGQHQRALILCSEVTSPGLDWRHPEAAALFGDGAVAVLVERDPRSSWLDSCLRTFPQGRAWCQIPGGGSKFPPSRFEPSSFGEFLFQMNGKELYRLVADQLPPLVEGLLSRNGLSWREVGLVLPHQASPSAMRLVCRRIGCPPEKFFNVIDRLGNMVAASIPAALHLAVEQGRLQRGQTALLLGTSAGVSLGASLITY